MTLLELAELLRKHLRSLILVTLAFGLLAGVYTYMFMEDEYTSTTSIYVLTSEDDSTSLYTELNTSTLITNDVAEIMSGNRVANETATDLGLESLDAYDVSVEISDSSRIINVSVTGADPELAADIASTLVANATVIATEAMGLDSVTVIETAEVSDEPSGPNRLLYIAVALFAGFFLDVAAVIVFDMLNTKVRTEDELAELTGLPVMGRIPYVKGGGVRS